MSGDSYETEITFNPPPGNMMSAATMGKRRNGHPFQNNNYLNQASLGGGPNGFGIPKPTGMPMPMPYSIDDRMSVLSLGGGGGGGGGRDDVSDMLSLSASAIYAPQTHIHKRYTKEDVQSQGINIDARLTYFRSEYEGYIQEEIKEVEDREVKSKVDIYNNNNVNEYFMSHAESLINQEKSCYIPLNIGNVISKSVVITTNAVNASRAAEPKYVPFNICSHDSSFRGLNIFGHNCKYAQGLNIKPADRPKGSLNNAFIFQVNISQIVNNTPHAIGIRLFHTPHGQTQDVQLGDTRFYNRDKRGDYNFIVMPFSKPTTDTSCIFRSNKDTNHEMTERYPWITPNREKIMELVEQFGKTDYMIPILHPLIQYIYDQMAYYPNWSVGDNKPVIMTNNKNTPCFKVSKEIAEKALSNLITELRTSLPVVDLSTLKISFDYLFDMDSGSPDTQELGSSSSSSSKNSVAFLLEFIYAFRDVYEVGEEQYENDKY